MKQTETCPKNTAVDPLRRFVRIKKTIRDKFVEFDFAVGDPGLYVELILPTAAFEVFCQRNKVTFMSDEQALAVARDMEKWRYGESAKELTEHSRQARRQ